MLLSPEEIRPFGKAAPKKGPKRKKRKSEIYIDTPVKKALEAEAKAKKQPKRKLPCKANRKHLICNQVTRNLRVIPAVRKKLILPSFAMILVMILVMMKVTLIETPTKKDLSIDDHILVKFEGKRSIKYYVGRILTLHSDTKEVETTFMRRLKTDKATNMIFTFQEEDACLHALEDALLNRIYQAELKAV